MTGSETNKLCFVVGPIGAEDSPVRIHADWLLEEIIQPTMQDVGGYEVKRADQDNRPGLIDAQLINDLLVAELVIADLSGLNPNAFYEIGIRHMTQKPIIHMQLSGDTIPFDVSLYRAIKFSRERPRDIRSARDALKSQVEAIQDPAYQVENPITNARGRIILEEHATPGQQIILDSIRSLQQRISTLEGRTSGTFGSGIYGTSFGSGVAGGGTTVGTSGGGVGGISVNALAGVVAHQYSFDVFVDPTKLGSIAEEISETILNSKVIKQSDTQLTVYFTSTTLGATRVLRGILEISGVLKVTELKRVGA